MLVAPRNTKVVASILACLSLNICVCVFGGGGGLGGLVPESGPNRNIHPRNKPLPLTHRHRIYP